MDALRRRMLAIVGVAGIDAKRSTMHRQFLHVENHEAVPGENRVYGREGEIREVFVIDGIELIVRDQLHEMRELDRDHAARSQRDLQSSDEVVEVRHLREHVVAEEQVRLLSCGHELTRCRTSEELDRRWDASRNGDLRHICGRLDTQRGDACRRQFLRCLSSEKSHQRRHSLRLRALRDVCGRLDPENRNAERDEVLEQIPVVAGHLDDPARRPEVKPLHGHLHERLGMANPRIRV